MMHFFAVKSKRREVRQKVRNDKKKMMDNLAEEADATNNIRELYNLTKIIVAKKNKSNSIPLLGNDGTLLLSLVKRR